MPTNEETKDLPTEEVLSEGYLRLEELFQESDVSPSTSNEEISQEEKEPLVPEGSQNVPEDSSETTVAELAYQSESSATEVGGDELVRGETTIINCTPSRVSSSLERFHQTLKSMMTKYCSPNVMIFGREPSFSRVRIHVDLGFPTLLVPTGDHLTLSTIAEHSCTIKYLKGSANTVVDANCINTIQLRIAYPKTAEVQRDNMDLQRLQRDNPALMWSDLSVNNGETTTACETSTGRPRPYLSDVLRRKAFNLDHNLSHPSGQATAKILAEKYIWWGMKKGIENWTRECFLYQTSKIARHVESGRGEFHTTHCQLAHIHVDIVGPLSSSKGYRYLFTIIGRNTIWPQAIPTWQQTLESCVKALIGWVSTYRVPQITTNDRGANITSALWNALADSLGTKIIYTMAYNREANGIIERLH
ncbi:uncharacterized protein [Macrobrachium rosenbergii]|uniref:uncharacterized protein n=1 Tax=Macrobrachium rosenbergii TaxID=79674 RepID=UPI0034D57300